ncbi:uncharacterized protein V6R79_015735 [Siganus canaliculatus]
MDIDALLEAIQDFDKKVKKETCPVLEQFLCHVAKTGQPLIPWSQFKTYFMFKLEKVMDDFHASTPEDRGQHNPNIDFVPFEQMKKRILKIVDGYNGIPFTIQRLCELLVDPKRNYSGTDKFLMGLEKNVMVVSCVYPLSDRNVNGPSTPKLLNRPKLSACHLLSTNGLPDSPVSKEPQPVREEMVLHHTSDSSSSESDNSPASGIKNKHPKEGEEDDSDADKHEVKRLKSDIQEVNETESEEDSSPCKGSESLSKQSESSKDLSGQQHESGTSCVTPAISEDLENSNTQAEASERAEESPEVGNDLSLDTDSTVNQPEQPASPEKSTSIEQENGDSSSHNCSSSSDGEDAPSDKPVPSSSNTPDVSTEGSADDSSSAQTAVEAGEHV